MALLDEMRRTTAVDRRSTLSWLELAGFFALGVKLFSTNEGWFIVTVLTCIVLGSMCAGCLVQAGRSFAIKRSRRSA